LQIRTGCQAHTERVDNALTAGLVSARIGLGHHINQSMGMGNRPARELWEISLMNTKIKVLSLVLGTAFAGSAAAVCPTSPVPPWTDLQVSEGTAAIADGGLDGTECRFDSTINAGAGPFSSAGVHDASPAAEPRYRGQFIINIDALGSPTFSDAAQVFIATSAGQPLRLGIFGNGSGWSLSYILGESISGSTPLAAGENRIEFDLQITGGDFDLWVNNHVEGSPTVADVTGDYSAMVGIDDAYLGLGAPSVSFVNTYGGTPAQFDQFDSRRTTFIGF
jgi:hypothetical protein